MGKSTDSRRTYKELKADPIIKTPALAWVLERKALYISFGAITSLLVGGFLYQGTQAYQNILTPLEVDSPFLEISPTESLGAQWASSFIKNDNGLKDWSVRDSMQPSHGLLKEATGNSAGEVPLTLLATKLATSGSTKALAQVYGAGQARAQYDAYVEKLSRKGAVSNEKVDNSGILGAKFEQGFILLAGDAIVGAQTNSNEQRDALFSSYLKELKTSLPASQCVDISGSVNMAARSLYYNESKFEGLREAASIDPEVKIDNLPTLKKLGADEVENPYAAEPESPLPASMGKIPEEVTKPTIADAPTSVDSFTKTAIYKIQDPIGPGCGWNWSAQEPLIYDDADLEGAKKDAIVRVQNEVNGSAQKYVDSKISWARVTAMLAPKLDNWNSYVKSVNKVHTSWDKLVADRLALRPAWDTYIANHKEWSTFDQRKADATKGYNEALKQCVADRAEFEKWEKEWGTEAMEKKQEAWDKENAELQEKQKDKEKDKSKEKDEADPSTEATPTPSATPEKPEPTLEPLPKAPPRPVGCSVDPEKPSILSEEKPAQPIAPELAPDVTIPNSWPQPE